MAKYGKGLNRETVEAIKKGQITQPFTREDVARYAESRGWDVPSKTLSVCLSNASSTKHSLNYRKYFESIGNGKYRLIGTQSIVHAKVDSGKTSLYSNLLNNGDLSKYIPTPNDTTTTSTKYIISKRFAIAPTDEEWFLHLRENQLTNQVNFWTPTPWNVKGLKKGERLYFMLKSPIRKIGGYGEFMYYENMNVEEAWKKFGLGNGVRSLSELEQRAGKYVNKRSVKENKQIGCIVLSNCIFLEESLFFPAHDLEVEFPIQVVKIKYFDEIVSWRPPDPLTQASEENSKFSLVTSGKVPMKLRDVRQREGQPAFRKKILNNYGGRCAVTGETCDNLLEAAHVQPYQNAKSNHVQNGILLRVDLHRLFDAGLMTIDTNFQVKFSSEFTSLSYKNFRDKVLDTSVIVDLPSLEALEYHNKNVFRE